MKKVEAIIKPFNIAPHKKHKIISIIGMSISPELTKKDTTTRRKAEIRLAGIISIFLDFLKTITKPEKEIAQPNAMMFP